MQYIVTGEEMKRLDETTSRHFGVPSVVLMEQAALAFVSKMTEIHPNVQRVLVVCGSGNNGGDGLAIARLLNQRGVPAEIYAPKRERVSELFALQWEICKRYDYPILSALPPDAEERYDVVVDAVFGTGLSRAVEQPYDEIFLALNEWNTHRIAVDIASGVFSGTGEVPGSAFAAADTITFSFAKAGSYLFPGAYFSGNVHVVSIGITEESFLGTPARLAALEKEDLELLPGRRPDTHKGSYGKLLVIAGSEEMAGAALLATEAAYRTGCGLVKVMTPSVNRQVILGRRPEAILSVYEPSDSRETLEARISAELAWADAIVMGPGMGTSPTAEQIVECVLAERRVPLLLDADALNLLAAGRVRFPDKDWIATPHLGEMSRLTGSTVMELKRDLAGAARRFAREKGAVCVLKDARTVTAVPQGEGYLNLSGNQGMATAGSGDVLSGVIGGLLAQGMKADLAAAVGVYLHGLAGDYARARKGVCGMVASDIADGIAAVLREWDDLQHINNGEKGV